jgi:hypothetical protein
VGNVHMLQMLPHALAAEGRSTVVLFLDFAKAYDTVCRAFLRAVMSALGVGPRFCGWVYQLLGATRACVVLNGHLSQLHPFSAGVRQGCPLSPLLYLLVGEALLRFMQARGFGITAFGARLLAAQFADDNPFLLNSLAVVPPFLCALATLDRASNQSPTLPKCTALRVGVLPSLCPLRRAACEWAAKQPPWGFASRR